MGEALQVMLGLAANAALPYWIIQYDLTRLGETELGRAWTEASFLSAVLAFGPLSLPVHFARTRRSLLGFGLGLALCALALSTQALVLSASSAALGID